MPGIRQQAYRKVCFERHGGSSDGMAGVYGLTDSMAEWLCGLDLLDLLWAISLVNVSELHCLPLLWATAPSRTSLPARLDSSCLSHCSDICARILSHSARGWNLVCNHFVAVSLGPSIFQLGLLKVLALGDFGSPRSGHHLCIYGSSMKQAKPAFNETTGNNSKPKMVCLTTFSAA